MFNNFINIHDITTIFKQGPKAFLKIFLKLLQGQQKRIQTVWSQTSSPPQNWWDIPAVRTRWNRLISGDPQVDYCDYISRKYLSDRQALRALSLGCGTGNKELKWAETSKFNRIEAYDLSKPRITYANNVAKQKGLANIINYKVDDIYKIEMREDYYDIVLGEQSLHHFSPLEKLFLRINRFLHPKGYFIVNEFVGPTRFQWTDRQLEAINGLLAALPHKYKRLFNSDAIKGKIYKRSRLDMILSDPSEAVESSNIAPLLHKIFNVVEIKEYGGTILQMLFQGIAHNFLAKDIETQCLLNICFEYENTLLKNGDIKSDFIIAICKKK